MGSTIQEDLIDALSHGATALPVWHILPRDRWNLLRDTLLGNVLVRGGMRTRDLPLDPVTRDLVQVATAVQAAHYQVGGKVPARFGDWLFLFSVLAEPVLAAEADQSEPLAHNAIRECVLELRRALGLSDQNFADTCPFHHRLLGVLGLSRQEWRRIKSSGRHFERARLMARVGARICEAWRNAAAAGLRHEGLNVREWAIAAIGAKHQQVSLIDELASERRVLATLKTIGVQQYLHRANAHWLMRGASMWCAQSLAFARDLLVGQYGGLILSDSDALVSMVFPADAAPHTINLDQFLHAWRSARRFARRFPRLGPYHPRASRPDRGVHDPLDSLPRISLRCAAPKSLLDWCVSPPAPDGDKDDVMVGWTPSPKPAVPGSSDGHEHTPCNFVLGDVACISTAPPWLEANKPESYGWTALCWSLCGTTMRTHWHQGICAELGRGDYCMMHVHHGGWLKDLGLENERLTFLKLDGDGVGARFLSTPVPSRPLLGLHLGRLVLARIIAATRRVIEAHDARGLPKFLPLDLVYFGGDDVFFCVPGCYVNPFLEGFGSPAATADVGPWHENRFSYIAIALPHGAEFPTGNRELRSAVFGRANLAAARSLSPGLRQLVKRRAPAEGALADLNRMIESASLGYRCVLDGELQDTGVVHGVRLRLVATPAGTHNQH